MHRTIAALLCLAGCGGGPPARPPAPPQGEPPLPTDWLVYDEQAQATRWIAIGEGGAPEDRAVRPGYAVAGGDRVYQVVREARTLTARCARGDESASVEEALELADYLLVDLVSGDRVPIEVGAPNDVAQYCAFERSCDAGATVGVFYFTSCCVFADSGGAHGSGECQAHMIDLRTGTPLTEPPFQVGDRELRLGQQRIGEHVRAEGGDEESVAAYALDTARATELMPTYNALGQLGFEARVTVDTCYACSFGDWTSYTASVVVPVQGTPRAMAEWATIPRALVRLSSRGAAIVDAPRERRAAMLEAFQREEPAR